LTTSSTPDIIHLVERSEAASVRYQVLVQSHFLPNYLSP
jgi:hypothetical protein